MLHYYCTCTPRRGGWAFDWKTADCDRLCRSTTEEVVVGSYNRHRTVCRTAGYCPQCRRMKNRSEHCWGRAVAFSPACVNEGLCSCSLPHPLRSGCSLKPGYVRFPDRYLPKDCAHSETLAEEVVALASSNRAMHSGDLVARCPMHLMVPEVSGRCTAKHDA